MRWYHPTSICSSEVCYLVKFLQSVLDWAVRCHTFALKSETM
jgi:hypothetical protein